MPFVRLFINRGQCPHLQNLQRGPAQVAKRRCVFFYGSGVGEINDHPTNSISVQPSSIHPPPPPRCAKLMLRRCSPYLEGNCLVARRKSPQKQLCTSGGTGGGEGRGLDLIEFSDGRLFIRHRKKNVLAKNTRVVSNASTTQICSEHQR